MAVIPTGAIYKALFFDGESSRNYGVYITGEAVYNSPERDVEMIKIPGRNGEFALDNGRFENIEVTYPAGIFANNETDFAEAISDFRNFLASRVGYCRLEDEYNPNEYRMAVYKSGLNVDPAKLEAGEFSITFDCKPQRWLTSGETAVAVTSGDTLTNPTLFESGPLLEATGSGSIEFNGYETILEHRPIGDIVIGEAKSFSAFIPYGPPDPPTINLEGTISVDTNALNSGDPITLIGIKAIWEWDVSKFGETFYYVTLDGETGIPANTEIVVNKGKAAITTSFPSIQFIFGTASTATHETSWSWKYGASSYIEGSESRDITINYDGAQTFTISVEGDRPVGNKTETITFKMSKIDAYSSVIVTDPVFIDCDTGEAYSVVDGTVVDANSFVTLGSDLPKLASGSNTITFDNTLTELKVTPRWWKV